MSVRSAAEPLGISKGTAHAALRQLQDRGLIRPNLFFNSSRSRPGFLIPHCQIDSVVLS
jgi:DNA-binding transcriptional MocR family regulator